MGGAQILYNLDYNIIERLGIQALAYERSSIERCKTVFPDAVFFDIGAGNGLWSHAALQARAKQVVCFERFFTNVDHPLAGNLKSFGPDKVLTVLAFVTDKDGGGLIEGGVQKIPPSITIDKWIEDNKIDPTFVKMDIEGEEIKAIEGMKETIKRLAGKLSMMIEIHGGKEAKDKIVNMIRDYSPDVLTQPSGENWILNHLYHVYYLPRDI